MLESGLFFTLGFLASALLALMIAPAIWRRAVVLTRQRIESSVPLTLNEIQADKDQLRAEFAMSTRRLEVSLEDLKARAADQIIEINRRRDEALSLEAEQAEKTERIAELQIQSEELRAEMRRREEKLSEANNRLARVEARLEEKALDLEEMNRRHRSVMNEFDDQKIELVARDTKLVNVQDDVREAREDAKKARDERRAAEEKLKAAESLARREKENNLQLEKKLSRLQSSIADMEARVERRDRDLAKVRDKEGTEKERAQQAEKTTRKLEKENLRLTSELAAAAMRTEALLADASDENIENAVAVFETERKEYRDKIQRLEAERESLKIELSAVQLSSGEDWEIERRENAIVRERINDLAAQVTAMAAAIEGTDSPINEALSKRGEGSSRQISQAPSLDTAQGEITSLADRIRALQAAAEKA